MLSDLLTRPSRHDLIVPGTIQIIWLIGVNTRQPPAVVACFFVDADIAVWQENQLKRRREYPLCFHLLHKLSIGPRYLLGKEPGVDALSVITEFDGPIILFADGPHVREHEGHRFHCVCRYRVARPVLYRQAAPVRFGPGAAGGAKTSMYSFSSSTGASRAAAAASSSAAIVVSTR